MDTLSLFGMGVSVFEMGCCSVISFFSVGKEDEVFLPRYVTKYVTKNPPTISSIYCSHDCSRKTENEEGNCRPNVRSLILEC